MNLSFLVNGSINIELEMPEEVADSIIAGTTDKCAFMTDLANDGTLNDFGLGPKSKITCVDLLDSFDDDASVIPATSDRSSWSYDAVLELIYKRAEFEEKFSSGRRSTIHWESISRHMIDKNYNFSPRECSRKFDKIMNTFRINKEKMGKNNKVRWEFFNVVNKLFGDHDSVSPPKSQLINSSLLRKAPEPPQKKHSPFIIEAPIYPLVFKKPDLSKPTSSSSSEIPHSNIPSSSDIICDSYRTQQSQPLPNKSLSNILPNDSPQNSFFPTPSKKRKRSRKEISLKLQEVQVKLMEEDIKLKGKAMEEFHSFMERFLELEKRKIDTLSRKVITVEQGEELVNI